MNDQVSILGATEHGSEVSASALRLIAEARSLPGFVAVEGPIGVGKTTLAKRLAATMRYGTLCEPVTENPFLDRFYADSRHNALPTQLFFLLHRARQVADLRTEHLLSLNLVADFLIEKDELFARLTLDENEYALYRQIHDNLRITPPTPDLVIYLQAPPEVLKERIANRGIAFEQQITSEYLDALANAYTEFFHYYDDAPLLVVNAAETDFVHNDEHFEALLTALLRMGGGGTRQFFNPNPTLL